MFDLIDFHSFYSVWYWIALTLIWSWVCFQTMGMTHGMVLRASRRPEAQAELEFIAHVQAHRLRWLRDNLGAPLSAAVGFLLASIAVLGFYNRLEFFQALFMLAFPLTLVGSGTIRLATHIAEAEPKGEDLRRALSRRRRWNQAIAVAALVATAFVALFYDPRSLLY